MSDHTSPIRLYVTSAGEITDDDTVGRFLVVAAGSEIPPEHRDAVQAFLAGEPTAKPGKALRKPKQAGEPTAKPGDPTDTADDPAAADTADDPAAADTAVSESD